MKGLDELKQEIKEEASENPEKFFATDVLRAKGLSRGHCSNCEMYFWSYDEDREVCGEPECSGGYTFINDSPTDRKFSYIEAWKKYRDFMADRGYTPIDRYPVIARWRDDVEFTGASIYCFQPYVVSGEAEPPADELVIPQPSLRFNDVDNVGITGRHYVLHNHIGQTCFQPPKDYDQDRYFRDMFEFAVEGLGIPEEKLVLHEDSWGGGGNLGARMEFFVDGLELFNQVYMFYKQTPNGYEELDLKVLDMGMGQERITWISHGSETSYECVMPETLEKMKERTGLELDQEKWEKFLPHSSELNIDEVEDIDEKWKEVAEK
ncbi:MAG: alanine--tRNA ligase, partial [Nanohaloarchaea archaeon SW_7_46_7]